MSDNIQVVVSPEVYIRQIKLMQEEIESRDSEIKSLRTQLDYESKLRKILEERYETPKPKRSRRRREVTVDTQSYSDFKSDGKRKPHAADSIRSYDDFVAIQKYFLDKGRVRDWAMWTIGVSMGIRISDLLSLRFGNFIDSDRKTIKPRVQIYEQKTGKLNNILITESVKLAILTYLESIKFEFDLDGFLFPSRKTKGKMYEECGWRILSDAGKALGLPIVVGSHTMRKSFANIAACVDKSCVDMNSITKVQGLLNHGDQKSTMRYLGSFQAMFDRARIAVSDFVLGKTDVNEITAGNQYTIDDVFERIDTIEKMLTGGSSNAEKENDDEKDF